MGSCAAAAKPAIGDWTWHAATDSIIYDIQAPHLVVTASSNRQLNLQIEDHPSGSGVSEMQISSLVDFSDASWQPWQEDVAMEISTNRPIYVRDGAGNESEIITISRSALYLPMVAR